MDELQKLILERKMGLVESLGVFALKTLLTLNSGAMVVLLTLMGSLSAKESSVALDVHTLQAAMMYFLVGLIFVMIAIAVTYITAQIDLANFLKGNGIGNALHLSLMVGPPMISFAAFVWGFVSATYAFFPV